MSNTFKDKGKGYWNNGIKDENKIEVQKYLKHCRRHNREISFIKSENIKCINKILNKQLEIDLLENEV